MKTVGESSDELYTIIFNSRSRERSLINFILASSRDERLAIRRHYDQKSSKGTLLDDLANKLSGDFKNIVLKLFLSRAEYDTNELIKALKGKKVNESTVNEILLNRPNKLRDEIIRMYNQQTQGSIINDIDNYYNSYTKEALKTMISYDRDETGRLNTNAVTQALRYMLAKQPNEWVQQNDLLVYLAQFSPSEMVLLARMYKDQTGKHFLDTLDELSRPYHDFLSDLWYNVVNPAELYARKINESVKGLGTDDDLLIRMIVTRYDLDMTMIKKYYYDQFQETVRQAIEDDCSGSYKRLLIALAHQMDAEEC